MRFCFALALLFSLTASLLAEMTEKEMVALINKVQIEYLKGHADAIDQLKQLPTNTAIPALLTYYRHDYFTMSAAQRNMPEAKRIAKMIVELPGSVSYIKSLFKTPPAPNPPGWYIDQRNAFIEMMIMLDDKFAIRMLADQLDDPDNILPDPDLGKYLAALDIPGAPFSRKTVRGAMTPEGIKKWREWWEANKASYPELPK